MYTKLEVEQETNMQIELMEESMMTPKGALLMASCKRSPNQYKKQLSLNSIKTSSKWWDMNYKHQTSLLKLPFPFPLYA